MTKHDFANQKIRPFLKELGSSNVSPGGGAAAALTGSLGAALLEMTARINAERERKKLNQRSVSADASLRIAKFFKIKSNLAQVMQKDTRAFLALSAFPKEKRSGIAYGRALKKAAAAPLEICALSHAALKLGAVEVPRTGAWLASDLAEAGLLLEAAFHAGKLNVDINLKYIKDEPYTAAIRAEMAAMAEEVSVLSVSLAGALKP